MSSLGSCLRFRLEPSSHRSCTTTTKSIATTSASLTSCEVSLRTSTPCDGPRSLQDLRADAKQSPSLDYRLEKSSSQVDLALRSLPSRRTFAMCAAQPVCCCVFARFDQAQAIVWLEKNHVNLRTKCMSSARFGQRISLAHRDRLRCCRIDKRPRRATHEGSLISVLL